MTRVRVGASADLERALGPAEAVGVVREAFVAYARGEWSMPPKVYVGNYPAGDFRAMPAIGGGTAVLKWVTSFPANPTRGLPTVAGAVLVSDAETGALQAILDAGAVTALRTGAAAALASETLGSAARTAAVVGAGVNGRAAARSLIARGYAVSLCDRDGERAGRVAAEIGAGVCSLEVALASPVLVTVTPGAAPLVSEQTLRPGQHVSLMGADGPGKAEITAAALALGTLERDPPVRLFCDDWEQASHPGDLARAVEAGSLGREAVTELGAVLTGASPGRGDEREITIFDSTGLAIQDLAVARAVLASPFYGELPTIEL